MGYEVVLLSLLFALCCCSIQHFVVDNMCNLLDIPCEVLTTCLLPYLLIRDLQAVNVAFTSIPTHRAQIKELWKSYPYECPEGVGVTLDDLKWLKSVDVKIVSLLMLKSASFRAAEFEYIASNFPTLREFAVDHSEYHTAKIMVVINSFKDSMLKQLAIGCPHLEVMYVPPSYITDAGILALVQNCRQLHTISLTIHDYVTDAGIQSLCDNCSHLKHIGLTYCRNLTDASLKKIADSYPHLRNIIVYFVNFTDDGLIYLADKCHELRSVSVRCNNITSRGLTALWAANPNLLDVDVNFNPFISDDDIIQLLQCCPLLQKLNISFCKRISDAAVIAVAEHCPQLRLLDISGCNEVSDAFLIALGQHCHELKSIDISYLRNISDVGIAALAAGCPLLQQFYAKYTSITDAGVVAVARGCRDLRKIYLNGCRPFGLEARNALFQNCRLLTQVHLVKTTQS